MPNPDETAQSHEPLPKRPGPSRDTAFDIRVRPKLALRILVSFILVLVAVGTFANYLIYHVASHPDKPLAAVARRFDLGNEPSIPNWYSSLALLCCAGLLTVIAVVEFGRERSKSGRWAGMAVLFLVLAVDEAVQFHEMLDTLISQSFDLHGIFFFGWVIPAMLFVACISAYYGRFIWQLPQRTRNLCILSAALFVTGAIGMEMVAGVIIENRGVESIWHTWSQALEELLEMLGVAVFLYALTDYLSQRVDTFRIRFADEEP